MLAVNFYKGFKMNNINLEHLESINANRQVDTVSNKYSFIPTTQVVDVLANNNWLPVKASQVNCRKPEHEGFQKHMIRFRNENFPTINNVGDNIPEIVLTNSHNGLASFCIMAGIFRLVCSNGLIIADSTFATHRIKHMGYTDYKVNQAVDNVVSNIPMIANKVSQFQAIELIPKLQKIFATACLALKYGINVFKERKFDLDKLLTSYRHEDKSPTLWDTYNVVQEKLLTGGRFEVNQDKTWKRKKARGVNNISENVRINKGLWLLAEKMAIPDVREQLTAKNIIDC